MADNIKDGRIPVSKISVDEKFEADMYYEDFLLHPAFIPFSEEDLDAIRFWDIEALNAVECRPSPGAQKRSNFASSSSLAIMQKDMTAMQKAQKLHQKLCNFVTSCYSTIGKQMRFPQGEPIGTIRKLSEEVRHIGSTIFRFQEFNSVANYVATHSVNSFILTVGLADAAKMPQHHFMNLAVAALFHEVGLIKFSKLIEQNKRLSPQEFQLQKAHVFGSVNLLKPYNFSPEVNEAILQHHERFDGSGYPYGVGEREISDFGRYLGLICSYVAMTTNETYRESAMGHTAILTLLKQAKTRYDANLVRLLVRMLSLYPVGSYVKLSDGFIARVLRNNQKDPRLPVVQVLLDADNMPIENSTVVETDDSIRVVKAIPHREITPIISSLTQ